MLSSIFISRPRLAFVISIVITVAGLIAYFALPVAQFPDIVPPQVQVTATYPGADASAVEEGVAEIIEPAVNGVEKMIYMKSTSGADGSYTLLVSFEVGSNPDLDSVNVTNRVNQVLAQLPPEVQRLGVTVKKKSAAMVQVVTFYSQDGSKDALFLSNYATINALDQLARVPGVGEALLFGPLDYSMRLWLDVDRLSSLGLTAKDVINAVEAQNVQAAVGRIGAAPVVDSVDFQINLTAKGRMPSFLSASSSSSFSAACAPPSFRSWPSRWRSSAPSPSCSPWAFLSTRYRCLRWCSPLASSWTTPSSSWRTSSTCWSTIRS